MIAVLKRVKATCSFRAELNVAAWWRLMCSDHKDYQCKVPRFRGVHPYQTLIFFAPKTSCHLVPSGPKVRDFFTLAFDFCRMKPIWIFIEHRHIFKEKRNSHDSAEENVPWLCNSSDDQHDFRFSFLTLLFARSISCWFSLVSVWNCCSCARRSCSSCLRKASSHAFNLSTAELSVLKETKGVWL